jgi:hypothetical protein
MSGCGVKADNGGAELFAVVGLCSSKHTEAFKPLIIGDNIAMRCTLVLVAAAALVSNALAGSTEVSADRSCAPTQQIDDPAHDTV